MNFRTTEGVQARRNSTARGAVAHVVQLPRFSRKKSLRALPPSCVIEIASLGLLLRAVRRTAGESYKYICIFLQQYMNVCPLLSLLPRRPFRHELLCSE